MGIANKGKQKGKRGNPAWVKGGPSPNPTGRAKQVQELVQAFREDVPYARTLCRDFMRDKLVEPDVRLKAATLVLQYGLGRPAAMTQLADDVAAKTDEELLEEARGLLAANAPSTGSVQ